MVSTLSQALPVGYASPHGHWLSLIKISLGRVWVQRTIHRRLPSALSSRDLVCWDPTPLDQVNLPPIVSSSVNPLIAASNSSAPALSKLPLPSLSSGWRISLKSPINIQSFVSDVDRAAVIPLQSGWRFTTDPSPYTTVISNEYPPEFSILACMYCSCNLSTVALHCSCFYPSQIESRSSPSTFLMIVHSAPITPTASLDFSILVFVSRAPKISIELVLQISLSSRCLSAEHSPLSFHTSRVIAWEVRCSTGLQLETFGAGGAASLPQWPPLQCLESVMEADRHVGNSLFHRPQPRLYFFLFPSRVPFIPAIFSKSNFYKISCKWFYFSHLILMA